MDIAIIVIIATIFVIIPAYGVILMIRSAIPTKKEPRYKKRIPRRKRLKKKKGKKGRW